MEPSTAYLRVKCKVTVQFCCSTFHRCNDMLAVFGRQALRSACVR